MTDKQFIAHKYLSQYKESHAKIAELQEKIELFESAVNALCKPLTNDKIQCTGGENKTEQKLSILIDLKKDTGKEIEKHQALCDEIERLISDELLRQYYINGETIQSIAEQSGQCWRTVRCARNKLLDTTYGMLMEDGIDLTTTY